MWLYEIYLRDGTHKEYPTDDPYPPEEYCDYCEKEQENIEDVYCTHFTGLTVSDWERY